MSKYFKHIEDVYCIIDVEKNSLEKERNDNYNDLSDLK